MKYMLDTNIVIYFIKNKPPAVVDRINKLDAEDSLCMSFITYAELLKGAERSTRKADVKRRLDSLIRQIPVIYATQPSICSHYAHHATQLRVAGSPIGGNDLWIASHALAENCVLVTNNTTEFERITGLRLENWVN